MSDETRREKLWQALQALGPQYLRRIVVADICEEPEAYDAELLFKHADHQRVRDLLRTLGASTSEIDALFIDPGELRSVLAEESLHGVDVVAAGDELIDQGDPLDIPGVCTRVALTIDAMEGNSRSRDCVACGAEGEGPVCAKCLSAK